jgi:hypothetical protein
LNRGTLVKLRIYRAVASFTPKLGSNWVTLFGSVVTTLAAVTILAAVAIDLTSSALNPYTATVFFLIMPGVFAVGLALIPLGLLWERRRRGARAPERAVEVGEPMPLDERLARAVQNPVVRHRVAFVLLATVLNVFIFAIVTQKAVSFMDTPKFCGNVCHRVMQPEYDAHERSAHRQVACVSCHIGEGASGFVEAKTSGLRRVMAVMTGHYHRPIQAPPAGLPPARETCEGCHQPSRFVGNQIDIRMHFKDDEANTPQGTSMVMHVGGTDPSTGEDAGIHFHASRRYQIRYEVLDPKREIIGRIQKLDRGKVVAEYLPVKDPKASPAAPAKVLETRTMDCIDCHNRPTHVFDESAASAIDKAFGEGLLDPKVPWLKKTSLAALGAVSPARDTAEAELRGALAAAYDREHPAQKPAAPALDAAARGLATVYRHNVYPDMKLTFGTYRSNIGHGGPDPGKSKAGCFRCHSGDHATADGKELSSKCESCHEVTAKDELPKDLPDELQPLVHL